MYYFHQHLITMLLKIYLQKKEQGTLILFPSYTLHEVKPITKGERNSLVSWVTGKQFK